MENDNFGLIKVESSIVSAGNQLLRLQSSCLTYYYTGLRNWWNGLNDEWKSDLIYYFIDEEDVPQELKAQGKIFNKIRNNPENSDWEVIVDEKGRILREPFDFELEKIALIRHLTISEWHEDLRPVCKLLNLESIGGNRNRELRSLSGIENLTHLKEIDLRWSRIRDLEPLRDLIEIESLNFHDSDIENLDPLSNLHELLSLNIGKATHLTDLTALSDLYELVDLDCSSNSDIDRRIDFSPIGRLVKLEKLNCQGNFIETLDFLQDLKMLESLNLEESYFSDNSLAPLSNLRKLKTLRLSNTNVGEISPLNGLPSIKDLWIEKTEIPDYQAKEFSLLNPNCNVIIKDNTFMDWTCTFYRNGKLQHEIIRL